MYTRTLEQGFTFDISLSLAPGVVLGAERRLNPELKPLFLHEGLESGRDKFKTAILIFKKNDWNTRSQ